MPNSRLLNEGLNYKDMVGLIKPTVHVDEFVSKMGEDDDIMVMSFYVRADGVADDLVSWFEKGYDYVLDADRSPGEVKPNRFLVYIELERRTRVIDQLEEMLGDLETLTEHEIENWTFTFKDQEMAWDPVALENMLVLSPREWRRTQEEGLNEMRTIAGLPVKSTLKGKDKDLDIIRAQAGLL